ncbi:transmembrane protein 18 isoform X2 [Lepeophtheirus salmonis]|uniref:transmembrane protein 18 isoform X2 n=1 Tax=Lepeophtheirus salmonis TaxID=72036 RepID=UPI003AF33D91
MEKPNSLGFLVIFNELDWSEPWLFGVILFYIFLGGLIYKYRYENGVQLFVFVISLIVVYVSEDINEYLAKNHKLFTKNQYFDIQLVGSLLKTLHQSQNPRIKEQRTQELASNFPLFPHLFIIIK